MALRSFTHQGIEIGTPELVGFKPHTRAVTREAPTQQPLICAATRDEVRRVQGVADVTPQKAALLERLREEARILGILVSPHLTELA